MFTIVSRDFHIEGSSKWWSEIRDVVSEIGESVHHGRNSYAAIDVAASSENG